MKDCKDYYSLKQGVGARSPAIRVPKFEGTVIQVVRHLSSEFKSLLRIVSPE